MKKTILAVLAAATCSMATADDFDTARNFDKCKQYDRAIHFYKKAVQQGSHKAMNNLAAIYLETKQNQSEIVPLFEKSASAGLASPQFNLGGVYANGDIALNIVATDKAKSLEWFMKAAKSGYDVAEFQVFRAYLFDSSKTQEERFFWLERSAKHGYGTAMGYLAQAYHQGFYGLSKNNAVAYMWRLLSVRPEYDADPDEMEYSKLKLAELRKELSADEIAKGDQLAAQWKPVRDWTYPDKGYWLRNIGGNADRRNSGRNADHLSLEEPKCPAAEPIGMSGGEGDRRTSGGAK